VGIIVAGLVGMQLYIKRGLQGRMRDYAGQLTEEEAYAPQATLSRLQTNTVMNETMSSKDKIQKQKQHVKRTTNSWEETLPLAAEPLRW
jgi:hypothetical protein